MFVVLHVWTCLRATIDCDENDFFLFFFEVRENDTRKMTSRTRKTSYVAFQTLQFEKSTVKFLPYFSYHFTFQLSFHPYVPYLFFSLFLMILSNQNVLFSMFADFDSVTKMIFF
jgi:hypothetical protein